MHGRAVDVRLVGKGENAWDDAVRADIAVARSLAG